MREGGRNELGATEGERKIGGVRGGGSNTVWRRRGKEQWGKEKEEREKKERKI